MVGDPLPHDWHWVKLGDLQAGEGRAIVSGPFGSNIGRRFFVASGVPVIRGNNLTMDMRRFIDEGFVFVTEEKAEELKGCEALRGDIVVTAAGSLGQVGLIPDDSKYPRYILSNKQLRARLDPAKISNLYAFYWLSSPEMVAFIEQRNTGSSVPLINLSILRGLPIPLPPLREQKAIAHILGALDDKIELNRRMNETLEAMARAIFKSWFVEFDPVHAKAAGRKPVGLDPATAALFPASFQDSELGKIPKGWSAGSVGDIGENPRRGVQPNEIEPTTPYIALEHMPRRSIALSDWGQPEGLASNKFRFRKGEILFGKLRPYFHKVGVAAVDGVCSTDILVITPKEPDWFGFLLGHVSSVEFINYTDATSTGTKMPRTNWRDMSAYEIALPTRPVADAFNRLIGPMVEKMAANIHESRTLAAIRDALLPKLLSGEIRVGLPRASSKR